MNGPSPAGAELDRVKYPQQTHVVSSKRATRAPGPPCASSLRLSGRPSARKTNRYVVLLTTACLCLSKGKKRERLNVSALQSRFRELCGCRGRARSRFAFLHRQASDINEQHMHAPLWLCVRFMCFLPPPPTPPPDLTLVIYEPFVSGMQKQLGKKGSVPRSRCCVFNLPHFSCSF